MARARVFSHWAYDAAGNLQTDGLRHTATTARAACKAARQARAQTPPPPATPTTPWANASSRPSPCLPQPAVKTAPWTTRKKTQPDVTLVDFFTRLWNPAKSEAEHLGWAYLYNEEGSVLG